MKGKGFSVVFGGLALCGIILIVVGLLLGGRFGGYHFSGGRLVYVSRQGAMPIVDLPAWVPVSGWQRNLPDDTVYRGEGDIAPPAQGQGRSLPAPFGQGQLKQLDIKISAGYVVVQPGEEWGLEIDGPMQVDSSFEAGVWEVRSLYSGITSRGWVGDEPERFYLGGSDVTTTFTFTVPSGFNKLDLKVGLGESTVTGLTLQSLECDTEMGTMRVKDVAAKQAGFDVDMGRIVVTGFSGDTCSLDCNMGSIELSGEVGRLLEVDCDMGSVRATLPRPAAYAYNVEVGLGNVNIDGNSYIMGEGRGGSKDTSPYFELECGMGSISVQFI